MNHANKSHTHEENKKAPSSTVHHRQKLARKNSFSTAVLVAIVGLLAAYGIAMVLRLLASTNTLYLAPASQTINTQQSFTVEIRENSGTEPVNAVQANLSYPADKLDYIGVANSPAFPTSAQTSGGAGVIKIARGTDGGASLTGDQLVGTITFRAKTTTGVSAVNFTSGSAVVSSKTYTDISSGAAGGNYTINAVSVNPTPTPIVPPPPSQIRPTPPPAPPSTAPTTSPLPHPTTSPITTPTVHPPSPSPAAVAPVDGYTVKVTVLDSAGGVVKGASVVADSGIATTDANGIVTLMHLTPGKQTLTIKAGGKSQYSAIEVNASLNAVPQTATVKFLAAQEGASSLQIIVVVIIITLIIITSIAVRLFHRRRLGVYPGPVTSGVGSTGTDGPPAPRMVYPTTPQPIQKDPNHWEL